MTCFLPFLFVMSQKKTVWTMICHSQTDGMDMWGVVGGGGGGDFCWKSISTVKWSFTSISIFLPFSPCNWCWTNFFSKVKNPSAVLVTEHNRNVTWINTVERSQQNRGLTLKSSCCWSKKRGSMHSFQCCNEWFMLLQCLVSIRIVYLTFSGR